MRIDFNKVGLEPPPDSGNTSRTGQSGSSSGSASTDQTSFSFDQTRVQSLESQVLAQPEVRQAKVEALQQAIGKGEYSVSAGQVADAMASALGAGTQG